MASYSTYDQAQKAVDELSDAGFPVQNVAIVGVDLRLVESVLGRWSAGRSALSGMGTGSWFGIMIGLFVSLFATSESGTDTWSLVLLGLMYGAAFGIVWGLLTYALTRGRRDFVSRQALQAARYDVLCDSSVIGDARRILGLAGTWPPPLDDPHPGSPGDSAPRDPPPTSPGGTLGG